MDVETDNSAKSQRSHLFFFFFGVFCFCFGLVICVVMVCLFVQCVEYGACTMEQGSSVSCVLFFAFFFPLFLLYLVAHRVFRFAKWEWLVSVSAVFFLFFLIILFLVLGSKLAQTQTVQSFID